MSAKTGAGSSGNVNCRADDRWEHPFPRTGRVLHALPPSLLDGECDCTQRCEVKRRRRHARDDALAKPSEVSSGRPV